MTDDTQEYIRLWRDLYEEIGLDAVRSEVDNASIQYRPAGDALIKEFEEKERDAETLRLTREANGISRGANSLTTAWICLGVITLVITVLVAIASNM